MKHDKSGKLQSHRHTHTHIQMPRTKVDIFHSARVVWGGISLRKKEAWVCQVQSMQIMHKYNLTYIWLLRYLGRGWLWEPRQPQWLLLQL